MQLESIAKKTMGLKSFRVEKVLVVDKQLNLYIVPRRRSLPVCSVCGRKRPMCDKLRPRSWRHVKLWGIETFIIYSPRRVNCPVCGIKVDL